MHFTEGHCKHELLIKQHFRFSLAKCLEAHFGGFRVTEESCLFHIAIEKKKKKRKLRYLISLSLCNSTTLLQCNSLNPSSNRCLLDVASEFTRYQKRIPFFFTLMFGEALTAKLTHYAVLNFGSFI